MGMKERYWEATTKMANDVTKPWHKKPEFWIGIIGNIIASGALIVAIIALQNQNDYTYTQYARGPIDL